MFGREVFVVLGVVEVVFGQLEADPAALEGRRPAAPHVHLAPKVVDQYPSVIS